MYYDNEFSFIFKFCKHGFHLEKENSLLEGITFFP